MFKCEICGKEADKHHIVHKCEGGLDFEMNIKYLCKEHHRGKAGPHRNNTVDLQYKLELQQKLKELLIKKYYFIHELTEILEIRRRILKKLLKDCRLYKEGYKTEDIIFMIMGKRIYSPYMIESYEDFIEIVRLAY